MLVCKSEIYKEKDFQSPFDSLTMGMHRETSELSDNPTPLRANPFAFALSKHFRSAELAIMSKRVTGFSQSKYRAIQIRKVEQAEKRYKSM